MSYDTCPLCREPVERDFAGEDPTVAYMDGFHHKACLDDYFGKADMPPKECDVSESWQRSIAKDITERHGG